MWKLICVSTFTQLFSPSQDHFNFSFMVVGHGYISLKQTKHVMGVITDGLQVENIKTHHNQTSHLVVDRKMANPMMSMF